jgi:hypothetical protein
MSGGKSMTPSKTSPEWQATLLISLKALADESRLKVTQLLHEREYTVGDLAAAIDLTEPTVSHHLAKLREAGLLNLRMAGNQRFYRVNESGLKTFKQMVLQIEQPPAQYTSPTRDDAWIDALGWEAADAQILRDQTLDGKITRLPVRQPKKLFVILRWLATLFEADRFYTEKEVNAILKAVYATDHVSLRRDMVDFGYLRRERDGGRYWLTPAEETDRPTG